MYGINKITKKGLDYGDDDPAMEIERKKAQANIVSGNTSIIQSRITPNPHRRSTTLSIHFSDPQNQSPSLSSSQPTPLQHKLSLLNHSLLPLQLSILQPSIRLATKDKVPSLSSHNSRLNHPRWLSIRLQSQLLKLLLLPPDQLHPQIKFSHRSQSQRSPK